MSSSVITSSAYTVAVNTPVFTPVAGNYTNSVTVAISCPGTNGATIRYTTDGTDPTATSPVYASPFPLLVTTTVKAKAFKAGMADSAIAIGPYSIYVAMPTFSPAPGAYTGSVNVSLASTTTGAAIHYTTNGVDPTSASRSTPGRYT